VRSARKVPRPKKAVVQSKLSPSIRRVEDVGVFLAVQGRLGALVLLKLVEVFQEEQPGYLFGVIELSSAPGFFPKNIVNVFEGLLKPSICTSTVRGLA
jgi:hypothetical protein